MSDPPRSDPSKDADDALGPDYYVERGRVVFTAAYHLRRGWCCGSGCRHCPYDHRAVRCVGTASAAAEAGDER